MEENPHPGRRAMAAVTRLGQLIDDADPVAQHLEQRERLDALRDVEQRRLDAAGHRGRWWDDRMTLP